MLSAAGYKSTVQQAKELIFFRKRLLFSAPPCSSPA